MKKVFLILSLVTFSCLAVAPVQAQLYRVCPCAPEPVHAQPSHHPLPSNIIEVDFPEVIRPVVEAADSTVPETWLGESLRFLYSKLPGMYLKEQRGDRVRYCYPQGVGFDIKDNKVVAAMADIKGNWDFPNESWLKKTIQRAEKTAFLRADRHANSRRYYYKDFVFSIVYDAEVDIYTIRYDKL